MWRRVRSPVIEKQRRFGFAALLALIAVWPFFGYVLKGHSLKDARYHQIVRMEPAATWKLVFGYLKYQQQLTAMNQLLAVNSALKPLAGLTESKPDQSKTFVLVIGESTNSNRVGLYGYTRDTTPN
jgi:heptose-I-phosphate ethanolaminephosphotransferase